MSYVDQREKRLGPEKIEISGKRMLFYFKVRTVIFKL